MVSFQNYFSKLLQTSFICYKPSERTICIVADRHNNHGAASLSRAVHSSRPKEPWKAENMALKTHMLIAQILGQKLDQFYVNFIPDNIY